MLSEFTGSRGEDVPFRPRKARLVGDDRAVIIPECTTKGGVMTGLGRSNPVRSSSQASDLNRRDPCISEIGADDRIGRRRGRPRDPGSIEAESALASSDPLAPKARMLSSAPELKQMPCGSSIEEGWRGSFPRDGICRTPNTKSSQDNPYPLQGGKEEHLAPAAACGPKRCLSAGNGRA